MDFFDPAVVPAPGLSGPLSGPWGAAARPHGGLWRASGDTLVLTGMFCRGGRRGDFWRASVQGPAREAEELGRPWPKHGGMRMAGKVWLVGAGPSDGGLLTLKGKAVLEQAEVVVFDALVGPEILARFCPRRRKSTWESGQAAT